MSQAAKAPEPAILERVRKLLKLATSDNPHEAAAAAGKAQRLIEQHRIDGALLAEDAEQGGATPGPAAPVVQEDVLIFPNTRVQPWTFPVARALCEANACHWWFQSGRKTWERNPTTGELRRGVAPGKLQAAGTSENLAVVRFLLGHLTEQVEHLALSSLRRGDAREDAACVPCSGDGVCTDRWGEERECTFCDGTGDAPRASTGRRWASSFRLGAAHEIGSRLDAARREERERVKRDAAKSREALYLEAQSDLPALLALDAEPSRGLNPGTALVRVEGALARLDAEKARADEWVTLNLKFGKGRARKGASDARAFGAGRAAGKTVDLAPARHKLGGGR